MNYKKLIGKRIYLSPIAVDDAEKFLPWLNDFRVTDGVMISDQLYNLASEKDWIENDFKNDKTFNFSIINLADDKLIGNCGFHDIDHKNSRAEFGIMIGEADFRGQGIGEEVLNLLLDFGFNYLNFNSIYLRVLSENTAGIKCYEKCGFKRQAVMRQNYFIGGKYHDVLHMDILRSEFGERGYVQNKFL